MPDIWLVVIQKSSNQKPQRIGQMFKTDQHGQILVQQILIQLGLHLGPNDKVWIRKEGAQKFKGPYLLTSSLYTKKHNRAVVYIAPQPPQGPPVVPKSPLPQLPATQLPLPLPAPSDPILTHPLAPIPTSGPPPDPEVVKQRHRRTTPREAERRKIALQILRRRQLKAKQNPDD